MEYRFADTGIKRELSLNPVKPKVCFDGEMYLSSGKKTQQRIGEDFSHFVTENSQMDVKGNMLLSIEENLKAEMFGNMEFDVAGK